MRSPLVMRSTIALVASSRFWESSCQCPLSFVGLSMLYFTIQNSKGRKAFGSCLVESRGVGRRAKRKMVRRSWSLCKLGKIAKIGGKNNVDVTRSLVGWNGNDMIRRCEITVVCCAKKEGEGNSSGSRDAWWLGICGSSSWLSLMATHWCWYGGTPVGLDDLCAGCWRLKIPFSVIGQTGAHLPDWSGMWACSQFHR